MAFITGGGSRIAFELKEPGQINITDPDNIVGYGKKTATAVTAGGTATFSVADDFETGDENLVAKVWKSTDNTAGSYTPATFGDYSLTITGGDIVLTNTSGNPYYFQVVIAKQNYEVEVPFTTESFNPVGEFISSNAIAGGRSRGIGEAGNKAGDGSLDIELSKEQIAYLMYGALGAIDALDNTAPTYTISHTTDNLPKYDVYIQHGDTSTNTYKFLNQSINNFRISLASNSIMTASFDMVGEGVYNNVDGSGIETVTFATPDVNLDNITYIFPSVLDGFSVKSISVFDYVTAFDFTVANNISTDLYKIDASKRIAIESGELGVTGNVELLIPAASITGGEDTILELVDELDVGSELNNILISLGDNMNIVFRNCYVSNVSHDVTDRAVLRYSIDFQSVQEGTTSPMAFQITSTIPDNYVDWFYADTDITVT
jgi:hypothetical protein